MLTMEQYDWLERKGVTKPCDYKYLKQDDRRVYFINPKTKLIVSRNKDIVGQVL